MGTQQGWFHRSDFDPFAVDESTQRLRVGRPSGMSGRRTYVWFVTSKTLVDLLHLERVLPVPEAPVKDRDGGGLWLHVVPVVGDAKRAVEENGTIPLHFGSYKIRLEPNDTIALYHLPLNTRYPHNVRYRRQWVTLVFQMGVDAPTVTPVPLTGPEGDAANAKLDPRLLGLGPTVERTLTGSGSNQVTTDKIFFSDCKIGSLEELTIAFNFMLYYAKLKFMTFASTGLVHWEFDANAKVERVEIDTKVATSMGLLNVLGTLSSLMQARMPKDPNLDDKGLSLTLDYPWIKDVKSGLILELPFNRHHVV